MAREMITITREEYDELKKFKEADKELLLDIKMLANPPRSSTEMSILNVLKTPRMLRIRILGCTQDSTRFKGILMTQARPAL